MRKAKVLTLDIETFPIVAYVWGLHDQNVGLDQIKEDWSIASFAAKWLHEKKPIYMDTSRQKDVKDDKELLKTLWGLLDAADVIVTQNGIKFDAKKINARFFSHGMKPPSSYKHIDTCRIASTKFAFTSNKLEYMSKTFNVKFKKLDHAEYSGFKLWRECLAGNKAAWREMEKYNIHDVLATEELYLKMEPWDNSVNFSLYEDSAEFVCNCGSHEFHRNGFKYLSGGKYQRFICVKCGSESRDKTNLVSTSKRKQLRSYR